MHRAAEPLFALAYGQRTRAFSVRACPDPHGGGHTVAQERQFPPQCTADLARRAVGSDAAAMHHDHAVGAGQHVLESVLGQDDRQSQFAVDAVDRRQKIRRCDGVQLRGRFVEQQHVRMQRHDRREIQKLKLTAGQFVRRLVKPRLDAEITGHLRHAQTHFRLRNAEVFQRKRQFVVYFVGHDGVFGVLKDEADARRLYLGAQRVERFAAKIYAAVALPVRRERGLQMAQQRRLAAAAFAAQRNVFARSDRQIDAGERFGMAERVGKMQIVYTDLFHRYASVRSSSSGMKHKST